MNVTIHPSTVSGTIIAPSSKSITHRAVILASLAKGISTVKNVLFSDDTNYTIKACEALGAKITKERTTLTIEGTGGKLHTPKEPLFLGNSGSSLRMLTAVASLADGKTTLTGEERLYGRPMHDLVYALRTQGVSVATDNGSAPVTVTGGGVAGGKVKIVANVSSQYVTALLFIAPFAKAPTEIIVKGMFRSTPYITITTDLMKRFGVAVKNDNFEVLHVPNEHTYKAIDYTVEGDFSSASYFLAAAAILGSKVCVTNLNTKSSQGDRFFLELLAKMGCKVIKKGDTVAVTGPKKLTAITVDMSDYPDIVQTLVVVAAYADGKTHITNIGHLVHKETDRIFDTAKELSRMGVNVHATKNTLTVEGGKPKGTTIDTHNDHRMAMSMAIAALGADGETVIQNAEVVNKSYPGFFDGLKRLGANI